MRIDINCDLGEYDAAQLDATTDAAGPAARDDALMARISSASIACGAHAGDEHVMRWTIRTALRHGVAIGAHPGLADRASFGRRNMPISPDEAYDLVAAQIAALDALLREAAAELAHVKPHGALYNMAAADRSLADAIAAAVRDRARRAVLFGLAGSALLDAGRAAGLAVAAEAFADRGYEADGSLTPRSAPDALVTDPHRAAERVLRMAQSGKVTTTSGAELDIAPDTICIHGDGPTAVEIARAVRSALEGAGIRVVAPGAP
jgi:5-oxoprolinase (ATP-hydrolysing) subunit A